MDFVLFSDKTLEGAIELAMQQFGATKDQLEIEVIDKGSFGILGIGSRPAII